MTTRLQPGDTAPDFTLPTDTGETVTLSDLRGGRVIVYFYPTAMTPGCTKQACDFSDSLDRPAGRGLHRSRHLEGHPGAAREVPREGRPDDHAALRRRQGGPHGLGRLRREEALRQGRRGRHPLDLRRRCRRQDRARPVQRQGHRPRREAAEGPRARRRIGLFFAPGRSGGTGRHVAFRSPCLRVCGFESRLRHPRAMARGSRPTADDEPRRHDDALSG